MSCRPGLELGAFAVEAVAATAGLGTACEGAVGVEIGAVAVAADTVAVGFGEPRTEPPESSEHAMSAKEVLGGGSEALGLLLSISIGALVGSLAIASMPNRGRGLAFLWSALVLGIALVAFSFSTWLWVTALIMVVIGLGQAGRMSLSNVLLMAYTQPAFQGRVMSVYMMEFSLVSFGTFVVGVLAEVVGVAGVDRDVAQ